MIEDEINEILKSITVSAEELAKMKGMEIWHGTTSNNICSVAKGPSIDIGNERTQYFGRGLYTAADGRFDAANSYAVSKGSESGKIPINLKGVFTPQPKQKFAKITIFYSLIYDNLHREKPLEVSLEAGIFPSNWQMRYPELRNAMKGRFDGVIGSIPDLFKIDGKEYRSIIFKTNVPGSVDFKSAHLALNWQSPQQIPPPKLADISRPLSTNQGIRILTYWNNSAPIGDPEFPNFPASTFPSGAALENRSWKVGSVVHETSSKMKEVLPESWNIARGTTSTKVETSKAAVPFKSDWRKAIPWGVRGIHAAGLYCDISKFGLSDGLGVSGIRIAMCRNPFTMSGMLLGEMADAPSFERMLDQNKNAKLFLQCKSETFFQRVGQNSVLHAAQMEGSFTGLLYGMQIFGKKLGLEEYTPENIWFTYTYFQKSKNEYVIGNKALLNADQFHKLETWAKKEGVKFKPIYLSSVPPAAWSPISLTEHNHTKADSLELSFKQPSGEVKTFNYEKSFTPTVAPGFRRINTNVSSGISLYRMLKVPSSSTSLSSMTTFAEPVNVVRKTTPGLGEMPSRFTRSAGLGLFDTSLTVSANRKPEFPSTSAALTSITNPFLSSTSISTSARSFPLAFGSVRNATPGLGETSSAISRSRGGMGMFDNISGPGTRTNLDFKPTFSELRFDSSFSFNTTTFK